MRKALIILITLLASFGLQAYSNFIDNPFTPYPPGCVTLPDLQTELYGDNVVKIYEQTIALYGFYPEESNEANVAVYRVGCAEPNRSVVWVTFNIPEGMDSFTSYALPWPVAEIDGTTFPVRLIGEANDWGSDFVPGYGAQTFAGEGDASKTWRFVLQNDNPQVPYTLSGQAMTPEQYNGNFNLKLNYAHDLEATIPVPSTASVLLPNEEIPLNGRLSGNWVVEGVPDQGFVISVSEKVGDAYPEYDGLMDTPLVMFLSWYTYDANGDLLWLTGAALFPMGAIEVTIPIELVSNGEFFGSKTAEREVVGAVTISGINCNDLGFDYDLTNLGLGSGNKHLQRLFSLETAGYTCRDLEARILSR